MSSWMQTWASLSLYCTLHTKALQDPMKSHEGQVTVSPSQQIKHWSPEVAWNSRASGSNAINAINNCVLFCTCLFPVCYADGSPYFLGDHAYVGQSWWWVSEILLLSCFLYFFCMPNYRVDWYVICDYEWRKTWVGWFVLCDKGLSWEIWILVEIHSQQTVQYVWLPRVKLLPSSWNSGQRIYLNWRVSCLLLMTGVLLLLLPAHVGRTAWTAIAGTVHETTLTEVRKWSMGWKASRHSFSPFSSTQEKFRLTICWCVPFPQHEHWPFSRKAL